MFGALPGVACTAPQAATDEEPAMASRFYERLSAFDSSFFLFESPDAHMHVAALGVFQTEAHSEGRGALDVQQLRDYLESRLHLFPRYRKRLDFTPIQRHPIWVDDDRLNLSYHVRHTALPSPGNQQKLNDLAGRIMSQQLDHKKPLWELWLIEGLEGGRFALLAKVHHCMVDGASGVDLMTALLSPSREETFEPAECWSPQPAPGRLDLLSDEIRYSAGRPLAALRAARDALRRPQEASANFTESAQAVWQALSAGFRVPPDTPLNRPIGTHRRLDWRSISLAEVKDVKKHLDGTVNDVVLTVVTGAVRRFLKARRVPLGKLDFRVVIPVNMRSGPEDMKAANRVSALFLSLPIAERDPVRQFEKIKAGTRRLKRSRAAQGIELFTRFMDWSGWDLLTFWGVRVASTVRPYNMIVTNVPGPQFPLYLLGRRLETFYPHTPLFENQGMGVAVMSYLGKVCFGLTADWDLVPDLSVFARAIDSSFAELSAAAGERRR
jgi:WS/DGAT/MGAT family acyltransferase